MPKSLVVLTVCTSLMVFSHSARGDVVSFDLSVEFSGATPPASEAPWLTATFDDGDTAGSVTLTLDTTGLVDSEYVSDWMFNLDPTLDPTDLIFSLQTKTGSFDDPTISTGVNSFRADGSGYFDIQFTFATAKAKRFGVGESVAFVITGIDSLTAGSFDFLCTDASPGPYPTAAHVQSIGENEDSGWTTIPEPATLTVLFCGGGLMMLRLRRRQ